jgi:F-type H+-transporting ATPase subunit b
MLIDWFTVAAQVVNFLILVWLLKRFLYKPVLDAIEARERRVAAELSEAASARSRAQQERTEYEQKNRKIDQEREALLSEAKSAAAAERQALLLSARTDYESLRARLHETLAAEREDLGRSVVAHALNEVFSVARRLMADLSDQNLEERIIEVFIRRLRALSEAERTALHDLLRQSKSGLSVRSAFELAEGQRAHLQSTLREVVDAAVELRYEQAPQLLGGIELAANGYKLRWSIDDYLESLRTRIEAVLAAPQEP